MRKPGMLLLFCLCVMAGPVDFDLGEITDREGISLEYRIDEDVLTQIDVFHLKRGEWKPHGFFTLHYPTTPTVLYLRDLSMIPNGTNQFHIRRIMGGVTSPVSVVQFVIRRPIPAPVVVKVERFPTLPPMPPGMTTPIPESEKQASYAEFRRRVDWGLKGSQ